MRYSEPELIDRLAAAYVRGTLAGGARRRFERLQRERVDVQLAVAQWQARLGTLAQVVPPVRPAAHVWTAIEARTRQPRAGAAQAAPSAVAASRPGPPARTWGLVAMAGVAGLALGVVAASLVFVAAPALWWGAEPLVRSADGTLPASYVGLLTDAQGNGKLMARSLRHGRQLTVTAIGAVEPPAAGRLVLWAVPAQGAPFVLGPVPTQGSLEAELPETSDRLLAQVSRLLVTVETEAAPKAPGPAVYSGPGARSW